VPTLRRLLPFVCTLVVAGCTMGVAEGRTFPCREDADCSATLGYVCDSEQGRCVFPSIAADAGGPLEDAGRTGDDAGGQDAGQQADGGADAGVVDASDDDAGQLTDGGRDGGAADAGLDAGPNSAPTATSIIVRCEEETPCPFTLDASDPDGSVGALSVVVDVAPGFGTLGGFSGLVGTYEPDVGFAGEDAFALHVSDGEDDSDVVYVTFQVISRRSCALLAATDDTAEDGVHTLFPDGPQGAPLSTYCLMSREGGGWSLALKVDGRLSTFAYDAALWSDTSTLNPTATALDETEAKLASYDRLPVAELLLASRYATVPDDPLNFLRVPAAGASLHALLSPGVYVAAPVGRDRWLGLVPEAGLQPSCNVEGLNVQPASSDYHRVRIGIISNEQNDCGSPDSFVGVGAGGTVCGSVWSAGNRSCSGAIPGDTSVPTMSYVFVRGGDFSRLEPRASCSAHLARGRRADGLYRIDPDGASGASPFVAHCDMTTAGGGWTLLMRIQGDRSDHVLDNNAFGPTPCTPTSTGCKLSTSEVSTMLARPGAQVLQVRPDARGFTSFHVRATDDGDAWPTNLECSNRPALDATSSERWVLTSYRWLDDAVGGVNGDVGDFTGPDHYYPTPYADQQLFFRGVTTGLRSNPDGDATCCYDALWGTLWVRDSPPALVDVAASCKAHLDAGRTDDGLYLIDPTGTAPFPAWCDMTTAGGGWTIVASFSGGDGEDGLAGDRESRGGLPFAFEHTNLSRAKKAALGALSTQSLLVRAEGAHLLVDAPLFDATIDDGAVDATVAVTLTASDGTTAAGQLGWSTYDTTGGGDFGLSVAGFDHHSTGYRKLNGGCVQQPLYSYSAVEWDGDVGYDASFTLGDWVATSTCGWAEGGRLRFYAAVR
jgi:hypothetical protein